MTGYIQLLLKNQRNRGLTPIMRNRQKEYPLFSMRRINFQPTLPIYL